MRHRAQLVAVVVLVAVMAMVTTGASMHGPTDRAPAMPRHLTVDDDAAPLAVVGPPQFGWLVMDPDRGERQTAYEIKVFDAPSTASAHRIADTGRVHSSQQSYVEVARLRLRPDTSYWWTVRTWDARGEAGPFAKLARFDTGIGDADWKASWIRRAGAGSGLEDYSLFRTEIDVKAKTITRARVDASAGQQYDLRINGTRVAHGPSYSYPDEQYYEATDITAQLRHGENVIAFVTHWGQPGQGRPASVPGLIARATIEYADGSRQVVTTDGSWQVHAGPWVQGPPRNDEGDFVEHVDERLEPVGWDRPGFDASSWAHAQVLGPHPTAPFTHLVAARTHIVEQTMRPRTLTRLADGSYIADFGAVTSATPIVTLRAEPAGRAVTFVSGDLLDPDGHVSRTKGIQETDMRWLFDTRAGDQQLRPFGYLAYRYLEVDGAGETLGATDVEQAARHASMPDDHAASFSSSDPAVDAVWNLARHSALYDTQEQFLDTPTRERGQFLDDSYDVSQATMAAFGERNMTYEALRDFARSQARYWSASGPEQGSVNVVYPNGDGARDIPDDTENFVEWVWQNYLVTGDRRQLAALYPVVRNVDDYVARAIDPSTGLVTNLPGGGSDYLYGAVDWPPQMRYGYDMSTVARTTMNVLAVDDFRRVAQMATALHRPAAEANEEQRRADRVASAIRARLVRPDGILVDGLEANGTQSAHASQQANAYALAFGLVPAAQRDAVADHIESLGNSMGVVNFRVLLDALHAAGRDDALVTSITDPKRPGYAQILAEGATFTWESWDARQTGDSESHGWGAAVLAVLQDDLLGARVDAPGGAHLDVAVPDSQLTHATGMLTTERGRVPVAWTRDPSSGEVTLRLRVPVNVTATVSLPATSVARVSDGGRSVVDAPGIAAARVRGRDVVLTIGSGSYVLRNRAPVPPRTKHQSPLPIVLAAAFFVLLALGAFLSVRASRRTELTASSASSSP